MRTRWTTVGELVDVLRSRWNRGQYLRQYATGEPFAPIVLPVKAPTAAEAIDDLDAAIAWAERFRRDSQTGGKPRFAVEHRTIKGKGLGVNGVPARVRIETFEQLCSLLNTIDEVRAFDAIVEQTKAVVPTLTDWVLRKPLVALEHTADWGDLLASVKWIVEHDTTRLYLRHIDVPRVDTKFVERHQQVLGQLLAVALPPERIRANASTFAHRYGFRPKPTYTRFRVLSPMVAFPPQVSELYVRTDEFATIEVPARTVFVVENEISYLAFPGVPDSIVIFGEGFALTTLETLPWLRDKELVYWGDIDTHGFAILDRLRSRFPAVTSLLMDRETLLAHQEQLVTEPTPTAQPLPNLTSAEQSLYRDLTEDRFGHAIRLEQERIRFSRVRLAVEPWQTIGR